MSQPNPVPPDTQSLTEEEKELIAMYNDPQYGFKRAFPFGKALEATCVVTLGDTKDGKKYLRAIYTDSFGSELVMPYALTVNGAKFNRDFYNKVLRVNAPAHMKEHTLTSEMMIKFMPRLLKAVKSVTFSCSVVARYNKEKESKRVWIFESVESAEEYLETRKKSKGVPVPKKESETQQESERTEQSNQVLQSLGL